MSDQGGDGRSPLQQLAANARSETLRNLRTYAANREKTFVTFRQLDPHSKQTRDAKAMWDTAQNEYAAFARSIGVTDAPRD